MTSNSEFHTKEGLGQKRWDRWQNRNKKNPYQLNTEQVDA